VGRFFRRIRDFFGEVRAEIKKVIFPGRSETLGSTAVVIVFVLVVGVFLSLMDSLWMKAVGLIIR